MSLITNDSTRLDPETTSGINYIPRYIRTVSDMEYGSVVTHEHYNELLNLNGSQGDYNTEILRLLLTVEDPTEVPHVKYLDEAIYGIYDEMDDMKDNIQTALEDSATALENSQQALDTVGETAQSVLDILTGVLTVGKAHEAESISGVEDAGLNKYYGTNNFGSAGFHAFPPFIYADDMSQSAPEIDGIYFTPRSNSVDEAMLTEAVRTKLNRTSITDYDDLIGRPSVNNITLTGNKTLSDLGIQPAGSYLTPTEAANTYATQLSLDDVSEAIETHAIYAAQTYATNTALDDLTDYVNDHIGAADQAYARIFVGSVPTGVAPKTGDMLVAL